MFPVWPVNVNVPKLELAQTESSADNVPPTVGGSTEMVAMEEVSFEHEPLLTIAR